jgi:hypothetical protein
MAKEIMTTNRAVAEAVKLAKPQVFLFTLLLLKLPYPNTLHNSLQMVIWMLSILE